MKRWLRNYRRLTFDGQDVQFATPEEMADFLLLQDISANDLWEIIGGIATGQVYCNVLSPALARLLWRAARANRAALLLLVRAHALQLVNWPLRLLRTIRLFHQLSGRPQAVASGVDPGLWASHLSVLMAGVSLPPCQCLLSLKARKALMAVWEAYIDKESVEELHRLMTKIRAREDLQNHVELLDWAISHDHEGLPSATESSSVVIRYLSRRYGSASVLPAPVPTVYHVIIARLAALAKNQNWHQFLTLYQALLDLLKTHYPETATGLPGAMAFLFNTLDHNVVSALFSALAQHTDTAPAASLLTGHATKDLSPRNDWRQSLCYNCRSLYDLTYKVSCTAGNNHPAFMCEPCYRSPLRHGLQEMWLIESPVLAENEGLGEVAVSLIQAIMTQEGIDWSDPASHDAVIRWLRQEFFDNPELLRKIMKLLSGAKKMEWISQLIQAELENHSAEYQNPADIAP